MLGLGQGAHKGRHDIGFAPSAISNLFQWIDLGHGVTLNGADVSAITDRSGNGHNMEQTTAADQPLFVASAKNGKPGMTFDGVSEYMNSTEASSVWKFLHDGSNYSIFALWKTTDANPDADMQVFATGSDLSAESAMAIFYDDRSGSGRSNQTRFRMYNGGSNIIAASVDESFLANTYQVQGVLYDGSNSPNADVLLDNISKVTDDDSGANSAANPAATLQFGRRANDTNFMKGTVVEWLIYDKLLDATERSQIQDYFNTKYKL